MPKLKELVIFWKQICYSILMVCVWYVSYISCCVLIYIYIYYLKLYRPWLRISGVRSLDPCSWGTFVLPRRLRNIFNFHTHVMGDIISSGLKILYLTILLRIIQRFKHSSSIYVQISRIPKWTISSTNET
jgi:hypothetical protein